MIFRLNANCMDSVLFCSSVFFRRSAGGWGTSSYAKRMPNERTEAPESHQHPGCCTPSIFFTSFSFSPSHLSCPIQRTQPTDLPPTMRHLASRVLTGKLCRHLHTFLSVVNALYINIRGRKPPHNKVIIQSCIMPKTKFLSWATAIVAIGNSYHVTVVINSDKGAWFMGGKWKALNNDIRKTSYRPKGAYYVKDSRWCMFLVILFLFLLTSSSCSSYSYSCSSFSSYSSSFSSSPYFYSSSSSFLLPHHIPVLPPSSSHLLLHAPPLAVLL